MAEELDKTKNMGVGKQSHLRNRDDHQGRSRWRKAERGHGWRRDRGRCCGPLAQGGRLAQVSPGAIVRVDHLYGDEVFRGRMMAMGIVPRAYLSVLQGGGGRPLLVGLAGSRVFLDPRVCELVSVHTDDEEGGLAS